MKGSKIVFGIMSLLIFVSMGLTSCSDMIGGETVSDENSDSIRFVTKYSMEYPPRTIEELVADSVLIVRAKAVAAMPSEKRENMVVTDRLFEILQVYLGDKKAGDRITVEMLGGRIGDTEYVASGEKALQNDEEVILILSYPRDENDKIISQEYYIYYPPAGIYYAAKDFSAKSGERFVANDPNFSFDTATIQTRIDAIRAATE